MPVCTDAQWSAIEPLIEAVPAERGPWWTAAQTFPRWSKLGAWERLFEVEGGEPIRASKASDPVQVYGRAALLSAARPRPVRQPALLRWRRLSTWERGICYCTLVTLKFLNSAEPPCM